MINALYVSDRKITHNPAKYEILYDALTIYTSTFINRYSRHAAAIPIL